MRHPSLWDLVGPGGEFVFNCYLKNDFNVARKVRFAFYRLLRQLLRRQSFVFLLGYSRLMEAVRLLPGLGLALERAGFMTLGYVPPGPGYVRRKYRQGVLNTFDLYGSHTSQHHLLRKRSPS